MHRRQSQSRVRIQTQTRAQVLLVHRRVPEKGIHVVGVLVEGRLPVMGLVRQSDCTRRLLRTSIVYVKLD